MRPNTRKGALRARIREEFLEAHARGAIEVAIGRASDFYGPGVVDSHFGDRFWSRGLAGKPAECLGDPDQPHVCGGGRGIFSPRSNETKRRWLSRCVEASGWPPQHT